MKKVKSYTSVWNVRKVIYAINDLTLPFPVTFEQIAWFTVSLLVVVMLKDIPPISFIDGALLKYLGIPFGITFLMNQKTFDGKKPIGFIKSLVMYILRPKVTYMGKPVKSEKPFRMDKKVLVRSEQNIEVSN